MKSPLCHVFFPLPSSEAVANSLADVGLARDDSSVHIAPGVCVTLQLGACVGGGGPALRVSAPLGTKSFKTLRDWLVVLIGAEATRELLNADTCFAYDQPDTFRAFVRAL